MQNDVIAEFAGSDLLSDDLELKVLAFSKPVAAPVATSPSAMASAHVAPVAQAVQAVQVAQAAQPVQVAQPGPFAQAAPAPMPGPMAAAAMAVAQPQPQLQPQHQSQPQVAAGAGQSGYGLVINADIEAPRATPGSLEIVREASEALRISGIRIQELENELLELRTRSGETIANLEHIRTDLERDKLGLEKRISDMTLRADRAEVALSTLNEAIRNSFAPYLKNWKA